MFMPSLLQSPALYAEEHGQLEEVSATLVRLIQDKNYRLYTHSLQVANYAVSVAAKMALPYDEIVQIHHAALLHDIGKILLPNMVIDKPLDVLGKNERSKLKQCIAFGSNILEGYPSCQRIIPYIAYHRETWDGKGYPKHLRGANIPLGARIIAVCDYYDTIVNPSTESWAKTKKEAKQEIYGASGVLFDPEVVRAFISILG